ncbi:MAG: ABC transporter substrate-binding protein [Planctomycetota bacterium]|nr:ABC transporter substrate-binding protein [Planctomycetota bacterium]
MKWFYAAALGIAGVLIASPYWLLPHPAREFAAGRVVRYDLYASPVKSLDPATCHDTTSASFQANVFEGPFAYHYLRRPCQDALVPQLAAGLPEISPDALTYTIALKGGVKFHRNACFGLDADGRPRTRDVTAADFVYAFKRIADFHMEGGLAFGFLGKVAGIDDYRRQTAKYVAGDFRRYDELDIPGVQAIGPLTLRVQLTERFPQLTYALATHMFAPIPREAVQYHLAGEVDAAGQWTPLPLAQRHVTFRQARQCVGTGPYVWRTFKEKHEIVFVRNDDFRDERYPSDGEPGDAQAGLLEDAGKKIPFIDVLHYDYAPEATAFWKLFLARRSDFASVPPEEFDKIISPGRDLRRQWADRGIRLYRFGAPSVYWLVFNMTDKILGASTSLRQGLCASIDYDNYVKLVIRDRGRHAVNVLPESFDGHDQAGPGPYFRFDLPLARRRIEQARAELADKGLLADGQIPELTLDLGSQDELAKNQAEFFRQQFARVGVRLRPVFNDWNTLQAKVNRKLCQMYAMGWHADYPDAESFLQTFTTGNIDKQINNSNYSSAAFDELYNAARVMPPSPERTALYARMTQQISEDCPVGPLTEPLYFLLAYDWVHNVKPHPIGYGFLRYHRIDVQRRAALGGRED